MKTESGLTLVELLVSAAIMLAVFAMVFVSFIQTRKISLRNQMDAEVIQNARIGIDEMVRTFRMIGYQRDRENEQPALIEAAPFQISFNANLDADKDALTKNSEILLYDATTYICATTYLTGAETIRWTLDSGGKPNKAGDGIVDSRDINDDSEEKDTAWNPNDMALIQEVNGGSDQQVTLGVRGPYDANDQPTYMTPMFQYWLLENDGSFTLLGDGDNDHLLTGAERYFRAITSQIILEKVRRIQITVTTESDRKDPVGRSKHRRVTLSSEVSPRNIE